MTGRSGRKRLLPINESTEKRKGSAKRRKLNSGAAKSDADTPRPDIRSVRYTTEQDYWVRFHHYQLNFAVTNRLASAPKDTISCAYFNGYFQDHEPKLDGVEAPLPASEETYSQRTFKDFHSRCQQLLPTTLQQIMERSAKNSTNEDAKEFRPVIKPPWLASFREIYDRYAISGEFEWGNTAGNAELTAFLENIVDQQLAPYKPTWVADGTANILRRPALSLEDYSHRYTKNVLGTPSGRRAGWHLDSASRKHASDRMDVTNGVSGAREQVRVACRNTHADVGNALLNMAVMRPEGYDGDLNALVHGGEAVESLGLDEQQRMLFNEHVEAVRAGDALRERVFAEAPWLKDDAATGEAARGLPVRGADSKSSGDES